MQQAHLLRQMDCTLGEGPLWTGDALVFFDILDGALHRLTADGDLIDSHNIGRFASAAALTTGPDLLIATETDLLRFNPDTGEGDTLIPLEADNPVTRSNDGRADRQGGFWISTMGTGAEPEAGAIYRYYNGQLRCLRQGITVPNAICFSPDGRLAYFSDCALNTVFSWPLDPEGWPLGAPEPFFRTDGDQAPDGAIIDSEGAMWIALWGGATVLRILPNGRAAEAISLPVSQPSCPAFGPDKTLFITSAREFLSADRIAAEPLAGSVFRATIDVPGIPEPRVRMP